VEWRKSARSGYIYSAVLVCGHFLYRSLTCITDCLVFSDELQSYWVRLL